MAKTYLEVCPDSRIFVLDSAKSIGGVWATERLYPGLKTNNIVGSYEFGDFPMHVDRFKMKPGQHIPGAVVHEYLVQFAQEFKLTSRLQLQTKVESTELQTGGEWLLHVSNLSCSPVTKSTILAKKLVIATGLTSEPFIPKFTGQETFQGNFFHSLQLKDRAKDIEAAKEVVVLGANKSAWDTCYSAAMAGAHVNMIIRPGGGGPSWVWPVFFTPFKFSIQRLATTRVFTLFDPCIWAGPSGFQWMRSLLHTTWLGQKLVSAFWAIVGSFVYRANAYDTHPELQKLKPWASAFWMGNSLGIHNYDTNWFDLVKRGRIHVHIADVVRLSEAGVCLSNGVVIEADTFVCCTGWKVVPPIEILPEALTHEMGIPSGVAENSALVQKARFDVLAAVPSLREGPRKILPRTEPPALVDTKEPVKQTNYQLYRFMVPPSAKFLDHSNIAFIGAHLALNAITVAQAQALWITAFFQGEIEHLASSKVNHDEVQYQAILHSEYCRLRHPPQAGGAGNSCPDLCFDGLLYTDLLLNDLGIEVRRKGGVWEELFGRYMPRDYAGMTREWMALKSRRGSGS